MTPPAARSGARRRPTKAAAQQRATILAAARELISTGGFQGLSFADIGLAAGVSDDVVRRHFPDENAILADLLNPRPATTDSRRSDTKAEIVAAARRLFGERGFHAVAVDDLAAVVGVTGPAVYRHFGSKEDILAAAINSFLGDATERVWGGSRDADTLEAAITRDVEFVVEHANLTMLWQTEWRHLKPEARAHNIVIQRRYVQGFIDLLLARRPELAPERAETMVVAALALIMGAAVHPYREPDDAGLTALLTDMAVASLGVAPPS